MRSQDVLDEITTGGPRVDTDDDEEGEIALYVWSQLVRELKPKRGHMPMSSVEIDKAERILDRIRSALSSAKTRNPVPLRSVPEGGR